MLKNVFVISLFFIITNGTLLAQNDWQMVNGNKERTSNAATEKILFPPLKIVTTYSVIAPQSLSKRDNVMCVERPDSTNIVSAMDLNSGNKLWDFIITGSGGGMSNVPAITEQLILCGGQGGLGLFAIDRFTGKQKWMKPVGSLYGRHTVFEQDRVYVVKDSIYCLRLNDGETIWSDPRSLQMAPAVDESNIYIAGLALNKMTGALVWQTQGQSIEAIGVDPEFVFTSRSGGLSAHKKTDGTVQWSYDIPGGDNVAYISTNGIAFSDKYICFPVWKNANGHSTLTTLNKKTGQLVWRHEFETEGAFTPTIANGVVYIVEWKKGALWGFNIDNGDSLFCDKSHSYFDQPVVAGGRMYISSYNDGKIYVFENSGPSSIDQIVSHNFHLGKIYPNPFSNETTISFELSRPARITMDIHDVLGRCVQRLFNEFRDGGTHQFNYRNTQLKSGVYIFKLSDGYSSQMRKVIIQ